MPPARIAFWAATVAGIAFTVRSVLTEPPNVRVSAACALAYLALLASGVFVLRLRMFADAMVRGPADATGVALTFDHELDPARTREVLDALEEHAAKATFFVTGESTLANRAALEEISARGHTVGLLGHTRDRFFVLRSGKRVRSDLERAIRAVENVIEKTPRFLRAPNGRTSPTIARIADQLDLTIVGGARGERRGDARFRDGAIIVIDGASGVSAAMEQVAAKNLRIATLDQWLDAAAIDNDFQVR